VRKLFLETARETASGIGPPHRRSLMFMAAVIDHVIEHAMTLRANLRPNSADRASRPGFGFAARTSAAPPCHAAVLPRLPGAAIQHRGEGLEDRAHLRAALVGNSFFRRIHVVDDGGIVRFRIPTILPCLFPRQFPIVKIVKADPAPHAG